MYNTTQNKHKINTKKLKPGLVAFYDIRRGNGAGLFSKEKIVGLYKQCLDTVGLA